MATLTRWAGGLPPWSRQVLMVSAGALLVDGMVHGLQAGGSWLGLGALAGGWCWLARGQVVAGRPGLPQSVEGWRDRCQGLLEQFAQLEADPAALAGRAGLLRERLAERERSALRVALVSSNPPDASLHAAFEAALRGPRPLRLMMSHPLPSSSSRWQWSEDFALCDTLIYHLRLPLTAADLRWLEALPAALPLWLLVEAGSERGATHGLQELKSQWPGCAASTVVVWDGEPDQLPAGLAPLSHWLALEGGRIPEATLRRSLERLHGSWQAELERLRRVQWRQLQQRTQWLVAGGVLLTPSLSLDLLVVAIANGLMLREMARLWACPWTLEQLKAAAALVGQAALGLGVVEWSSQAFCAAFQLHGATWLVGGALQALSAAYLTRVIGRAMADLLARSVGVSEPDLAAIKAEAPLLVAQAAARERLDWSVFLQDAQRWLREQGDTQAQAPLGPAA